MRKFYLAIQLLGLSLAAGAQTPLATISIDSPSMVCVPGGCTQLTTQHTALKATTDYAIENIAYSPSFPFTGGTTLNANADDIWSPWIDLPFSFCFYGNNYNSLLVGSNGVVTFDLTNNAPLGACQWSFNQTIPNTGFPIKNAIYGVYQDSNIATTAVTNPALQNVNYYVLDTGANAAPNRVFVINFNELPQYQCNNSVGLQTSQIVMHEGTNIIEIFVNKRTACTSWNAGSGLIGIQNQAGTAAVVPPGRNTGAWTATNEAWRITPNGADLPLTYQWYRNGILLPNEVSDTMTACMDTNDSFYVDMIFLGCDGDNTTVSSNTVTNLLLPDPGFNAPVDFIVCTESPFVYTTDLTSNTALVLNGLSPVDYFVRYYDNLSDAENVTNNTISNPVAYSFTESKTIYIVIENMNMGCFYIKPFELTVVPPVSAPSGNPNQDFTAGQTLANLAVEGSDIVWYDAPTAGNVLPSTTLLQDDTTYYAAQTVSGCESNRGNNTTRLAVTVNLVTLSNEIFTAGSFSVFPNPVHDKLTISAQENLKSISVYNTIGQRILQLTPNQKELQINTAAFDAGVYFVKIDTEKESRTIKIIKN